MQISPSSTEFATYSWKSSSQSCQLRNLWSIATGIDDVTVFRRFLFASMLLWLLALRLLDMLPTHQLAQLVLRSILAEQRLRVNSSSLRFVTN